MGTGVKRRMRGAMASPIQHSIWRLDIAEGDIDALELGVMLDSRARILAAEAGELVAAEGQLDRRDIVLVDPAGAGLELSDDPVAAGQVGGEDAGGKTVLGVVRPGDDLVLVLEI